MSEVKLWKDEQDRMRDICHLVEQIESEAERVKPLIMSFGREDQTLEVDRGLKCSIEVVKELSCGYGFGGKIDPRQIDSKIGCIEQFLKQVEYFDHTGRSKEIIRR